MKIITSRQLGMILTSLEYNQPFTELYIQNDDCDILLDTVIEYHKPNNIKIKYTYNVDDEKLILKDTNQPYFRKFEKKKFK